MMDTSIPLPKRIMRLSVVALVIVLIWLGLLPRIAEWSPVAEHLELMRVRKIDASAMFYTELEPRP